MKIGSKLIGVACIGCAVWFSGCGEQSPAPEKTAPAKPAAAVSKYAPAQTIPGRAIERGNVLDCGNNLKQVGVFVQIYANDHGDWLPGSAADLANAGCPENVLKCPDGGKYELIVSGKVRNTGKIDFMRCPAHKLVLRSDGQVVAAE